MTVGFWALFGLLALSGIGITIICFLSDAPVGGVITCSRHKSALLA